MDERKRIPVPVGMDMELKRGKDMEVSIDVRRFFDTLVKTGDEVRGLFQRVTDTLEQYVYDPKPLVLFEDVPKVDEDEAVVLETIPVLYPQKPFSVQLGRVGHHYFLRVDPSCPYLEEILDIVSPRSTEFDNVHDTDPA